MTGQPKSVSIDTSKLADQYPELNDMTPNGTEQMDWIANKFGVSEDLLQISGGKIFINSSDFGVGATRALADNALSFLDDGSISSAIKLRVMGEFFNAPSLFHPIKRLTAAAENKLFGSKDSSVEQEEDAQEDLLDPPKG